MMFLLPLIVPWFLIAGLVASSSKPQHPEEDGTTVPDSYLKPFDLQLHDFPQTGRGIRTLIDRSPGDILLKIPVEDTITIRKVQAHLQDVFDISHPYTEEQLLALGLLLLRDEHHPYVSSTMLPKEHFSVWNLPGDLWANSLCLPRCYRESFQATRNMVLEDFAKTINGKYSTQDVLWAFSMVRSRSIAVPELKEANDDQEENSPPPLALIPGLDLFNHAFEAGTLLQLADDQWTLTSSKSYTAGDQIYLSYGDDKDDWKLLLTYGFSSFDNNPNALVFWTWEDLLEAAVQASTIGSLYRVIGATSDFFVRCQDADATRLVAHGVDLVDESRHAIGIPSGRCLASRGNEATHTQSTGRIARVSASRCQQEQRSVKVATISGRCAIDLGERRRLFVSRCSDCRKVGRGRVNLVKVPHLRSFRVLSSSRRVNGNGFILTLVASRRFCREHHKVQFLAFLLTSKL
jgi:hypothetical protein